MVLVWIVIGAIAVQFILAKYTAEDAHSRGHDETQWFLLVMIFGIFAIIIYLLTRNDRRIPESERPPNNLNPRLSSTLLYGGSSLGGIILSWYIGGGVVRSISFPENWRILLTAILLFGLIAPPVVIYLERSRGILSQYF